MNSNTIKLQNALRNAGGQFKNYMLGGNLVPDMSNLTSTGVDANGNVTFTAPTVQDRGKLRNTVSQTFGMSGDPIQRASALLAIANSVKGGVDQARYERQMRQEQQKLEQEQRQLEQETKQAENQQRQQSQQNEAASSIVKIGDTYYKKVDPKKEDEVREKARKDRYKKAAKKAVLSVAIGAAKGASEPVDDMPVDEAMSPQMQQRLTNVGQNVLNVGKGLGDMAVGTVISNTIHGGLNRAGYYGAKAIDGLKDVAAKRAEVKAQREILKANQKYQKEQQAIDKKYQGTNIM